ncbi:MAG: hypothetical protein ACYCO4_05210 [Sulfobacillus sp.]
MKPALVACWVVIGLLLAGCGTAPPASSPGAANQAAHKRTADEADAPAGQISIGALDRTPQSYQDALAAVDHFLQDWQANNATAAASLLVPSQRPSLRSFSGQALFGMAGGSNVSYEVIGISRLSTTSYQFDVWLYVYVMGAYGPAAQITRASPFVVTVAQQGGANGPWQLLNIPSVTVPGFTLLPSQGSS